MLAALAGAACGGGEHALRPVAGEIPAAIEAVEDELGGPQQYFEVNATPQFVNVFVAIDGGTRVQTYLFVDGDLEPPTPPAEADGSTFATSALTFDAEHVLDGIDDELPDSDVVVFSIVGGPEGAVRYGAIVQSKEGGRLDVTLGADGSVLAVDPA